MSSKSGMFDFRTILYILIIVLIILGVIYGLTTGEEDTGTDIRTPHNILLTPSLYVNKNIVVRGIYYSEDEIVADPTTADVPYANGLNLDLETNNKTGDVSDGNKYDFYGKLEWIPDTPIPNTSVILIVTEVKPV